VNDSSGCLLQAADALEEGSCLVGDFPSTGEGTTSVGGSPESVLKCSSDEKKTAAVKSGGVRCRLLGLPEVEGVQRFVARGLGEKKG